MTTQTKWHRHWHVTVPYHSRRYRLLKIELVRTRDIHRAERSRFVWGQPSAYDDYYVLTVLGLLHTLTGLTIRIT